MAIFVSNPTSAAIPTLSPDALDPSVMSPDEGFTEELAAAMQPSAAPTDVLAKTPLDILEEAGKKASDLQILPAEVLLNAVGDANFAFTGQAGAANSVAQNSVSESALTDASEAIAQDATAQDLANQLQGAELAAANLAAQMSASAANVPVALASKSAEVSAELSINNTSGAGQNAAQASQSPVTGPSLQEAEQVSSATTLASAQNTSSVVTESINATNVPTSNQAERISPVTRAQAEMAKAVQSDAAGNVSQVNAASTANAVSTVEAPMQQAVATSNNIKPDGVQAQADVQHTAIVNQASAQANAPVAVDPSLALKSDASAVAAKVSSDAQASAVVDMTAANVAGPQTTSLSASTAANSSDAKITRTVSTQAAPVNVLSPPQSIELTNLATEKTAASSDTKADAQVTQGQESAFNFDAKLAKSDALQNPKVIETAGSLAGIVKSSAQINTQADAIASTPEIDSDLTSFSNVQSGMKTGRADEVLSASANAPTASSASANRMDSAALSATSPSSTGLAQEAPRAEATQSLEDISSSFVSSLVGGPQRPVTTVMDWISMQSQERPAPLVPHEVRLDTGAVQMEIQKMVKQGGGHVVMELTPPDQSKFTIELKLDERGNALLIVEGVSDSTKTRLEQSAPQLREQFQQMGLELQLDMRQQGQFASSNAANFADAQERGSGDNNLADNGTGEAPKVLTQREAGANRARETGSNQVYLYA
jgi:hypothetical protein